MKYIKQAVILTAALWVQINVFAQTADTTQIWVNGTCAMCMDRIEEAAIQTLGVKTASWDEATRMLTVTTNDDFVENNLHYAVTGIGHDTKKFLASDDVYEGLFACCKYRELRDVEEQEMETLESKTINENDLGADQVAIWVDGICGMCQDRIEKTALQTLGVEAASWDLTTKMLTVTTNDDFVENNLHYAVTGVGHDTKKFTATA